MKFIFNHHSLLYMLEQFPQNIASELWKCFSECCNNGVIISHRESQKLFELEAIEQNSLNWCKKNSSIFKTTTVKEAKRLGEMMDSRDFEFLATPNLIQRRLPEAIPFILCAAKEQSRVFVYRKNKDIGFIPKIKSLCDLYDIKHMEVEECLMLLRQQNSN